MICTAISVLVCRDEVHIYVREVILSKSRVPLSSGLGLRNEELFTIAVVCLEHKDIFCARHEVSLLEVQSGTVHEIKAGLVHLGLGYLLLDAFRILLPLLLGVESGMETLDVLS